MTIDITDIIVAFIGLIGVIITSVVIPYFKAKTSKEHWDIITQYAYAGVQAAEIIFNATGKGEEKLKYVMDYIQKKCAEKHIKIDMDTIRIAIENAWKLHGFDKHEEVKVIKSTAKKVPAKADQK